MKIQLVSLRQNLRNRIDVVAEIINSSSADFVLFPGRTLKSLDDARSLVGMIENHRITALIEVANLSLGDLNRKVVHCPFLIKDGALVNLHTFQFFTTSKVIENDDFLAEAFVNELETRRQFDVGGLRFLLLQCGENNILRNIQAEGNRCVVRINETDLKERFQMVLNGADVLLNVIHSPQYGNQNKLQCRREYFSRSGRYYFSTNNCEALSATAKSIQYAYHNGEAMDDAIPVMNEAKGYMFRIFEILS